MIINVPKIALTNLLLRQRPVLMVQTFVSKGRNRKDCDWVGRKPNKRCGKKHRGSKLWEYCQLSCGDCEDIYNTRTEIKKEETRERETETETDNHDKKYSLT